MARPREKYWFALKVFYNKVGFLQEIFKTARYETFVPTFASLLFVKCPMNYLENLKKNPDLFLGDKFMYYRDTDGIHPGTIPDHEMEVFMLAASNPEGQFLGSDTEEYMVGDKVRITQGLYKGYEGYIRRIKHDRKLIVCLQGVAVVAFGNVNMEFVEKI